jgi:hypothetical protein
MAAFMPSFTLLTGFYPFVALFFLLPAAFLSWLLIKPRRGTGLALVPAITAAVGLGMGAFLLRPLLGPYLLEAAGGA